MKIPKTKNDIPVFLVALAGIAGAMFLAYLPRPAPEGATGRIVSPEVFMDHSGLQDAAAAAAAPYERLERPSFYHPRTKATVWIRFQAGSVPSSTGAYLHITNASLEDVQVYFPGRKPVQLGKRYPYSSVKVKTRLWNVELPSDLVPEDTVYVRVRTNTIMSVPLSILTAEELISASSVDSLIFGAFFGLLATVFFVNLFSWLVVKDSKFATYLAYIAFLITYHLRVHGFLWMLPISFPVLEVILWVSLGGFGIFMMRFAERFLDLRDRLPVMSRVLRAGVALFAVQTVLGIFQFSYVANQIAYITGFLVPLTIIATTAWLYLNGLRQTRFYLLAWCFLFSGTLVWSTSALLEAYIPSNYFFLAGTSIDTLLFTLAIFDVFKRELMEKEAHIEREEYYQKLSHTDPLTGLYNRHYLNDLVHRLNNAEEIPPESAVIMLDLDNFKLINDTYGHLTGDMILTKVGERIRSNVRKSDIACRYGGDEFLIFLPGATERAAIAIAESIKEAIITDYVYSERGEAVHVTVSMGITNNHQDDSFDGLFLRADAALYQAKRTGRNRISVL